MINPYTKEQEQEKIDAFNAKTFRYSASSIKSWIQCGTKFKYEKVLKIPPEVEIGHARWLGKVVHASIYQSIGRLDPADGFKSWQVKFAKPNELAALHLFQALWNEGDDDLTKEIYKLEVGSDKPEGRFFKKAKVAALNVDDQEELEAAWKAVAREMVKNGVKVLGDYSIVELERSVNFQFQGREFAGFLDVIGKDEDGKYVFLDFKTVWDKPTPEKLRDDPQFVFYSIALKEALGLDYYPEGFFVHLRSGAPVRFTMSPQVLAAMEKKIKSAFSNLDDKVFFHKPGVLCNYCDFQSFCPK